MNRSKNDALLAKQFIFALVVFLIMIALQAFALELLSMPVWLKVVVTLLPALPLIWAFFIFRARYQLLDEYMKALTGEALLWMIGILCFSSFIYGMLAMQFSMPAVELALVTPIVLGGHSLILHILIWKDDE